ncbi:Predicted DNA-binding protein, MmcQ/YjbR family [Saccharicrinis carchari]|uniref:Predicted DNA-binding protein, MmcQ/YjbR family n=1 Tax=Saccharicrinis carchari TaxID=1168039 RepID=A0A521DFH6_SACCC|nr:MmcQ/YjbR family DNA-binding protein [Saccharicrinis carchari]SMO70463.1 Predicted DNA-binding protein, MmcQ/YjbR family [Saccharicrinis carchari]
MNIEEIRNYCLLKKGTSEALPFDQVTLVFKVMGKMFALTNLEGDLSINLKCDPEKAIQLREQYESIQPGYHMSKVHWNTVQMDGSLKPDFVMQMIDHSYDLVVSKLTKKQKEKLALC